MEVGAAAGGQGALPDEGRVSRAGRRSAATACEPGGGSRAVRPATAESMTGPLRRSTCGHQPGCAASLPGSLQPRPTFDRVSVLNRVSNLIHKKKLYALRSQPVDQLMRLRTRRDVRHRRPANVREQRKAGPTQADGRLAGLARITTVGAADVIDRLAPLAFIKRTDDGLQYRLQGRGVPFPEKPRGPCRRADGRSCRFEDWRFTRDRGCRPHQRREPRTVRLCSGS